MVIPFEMVKQTFFLSHLNFATTSVANYKCRRKGTVGVSKANGLLVICQKKTRICDILVQPESQLHIRILRPRESFVDS